MSNIQNTFERRLRKFIVEHGRYPEESIRFLREETDNCPLSVESKEEGGALVCTVYYNKKMLVDMLAKVENYGKEKGWEDRKISKIKKIISLFFIGRFTIIDEGVHAMFGPLNHALFMRYGETLGLKSNFEQIVTEFVDHPIDFVLMSSEVKGDLEEIMGETSFRSYLSRLQSLELSYETYLFLPMVLTAEFLHDYYGSKKSLLHFRDQLTEKSEKLFSFLVNIFIMNYTSEKLEEGLRQNQAWKHTEYEMIVDADYLKTLRDISNAVRKKNWSAANKGYEEIYVKTTKEKVLHIDYDGIQSKLLKATKSDPNFLYTQIKRYLQIC